MLRFLFAILSTFKILLRFQLLEKSSRDYYKEYRGVKNLNGINPRYLQII